MKLDRKKLVPLALFVLNGGVLSAASANAQSEASENALEEVLVWGTEVRASSISLDEQAITIKQADHISDLLRTIPGVDVGGAHSLNQRITIRSMDDKDLRISIDGADQNNYMYHHMGNLHINADILSSVDVEVGSNSVINGGLGGAVRFETKSAKQMLDQGESFGGRAQFTAGDNYGSAVTLTGYGQLTSALDVVAYHNNLDRDNYKVGGGEIVDFSGQLIDGTDGVVRGLEGDLTDSLFKLGLDISDGQRLELGFEVYEDAGDYSYRPDMGLATDLAITNRLGVPLLWATELKRDTFTVNYDLVLGSHDIKLAVFDTQSELNRDETGWVQNARFAGSAGLIQGSANNKGINLLVDSEMVNHRLTYGVEVVDYDTFYQANYLDGSNEHSTEGAKKGAVYLQDRIALSDTVSVIPGIRYSKIDINSAVVNDSFSDVTLSLAGELELGENTLLRLSSTELFQGPEVGEVFTGAGLFDIANPGIEAEGGLNTELALAFEDQLFGADRFGVGVTLFKTQIDNYIYDYATPPPAVQARSWKDNVGNLKLDGVEAYVSFEKGEFSALLTYSDAQSRLDAFSQYASLDGARLDRTQGETLSLNMNYNLDAYDLELHWNALSVGSVEQGVNLDGATANNAKHSYTVHNVSARWSPSRVDGVEFTFGIDNVFDEFYASQSSRTGLSRHPFFGELYLLDYEPGRNVKATLAYQF